MIRAALTAMVFSASPALLAEEAIHFVAFGDSGYIPAYERPDPEEPLPTTLGDYLALEAADWIEHHGNLKDFTPTPWVFESSLGGYLAASGLYPVAKAMTEQCARDRCRFALMLGDNIYPDGATLGSDGISDARRFEDMLDRPFAALGQGIDHFTTYAILGNHDWHHSREGALAQWEYLKAHPRFTMDGLFYSAQPKGLEGQLELFFIDTEMLLASTTVRKDELDGEGNEMDSGELEEFPEFAKPATDAERAMVAWLDRALKRSKARWKIVLGHHALWSGGGSKYEKARALRKMLMPSLCAGADAYLSGDDHMLEVYSHQCANKKPLPTLVTGAAGKYRAMHPKFMAQQARNNPEMRHHFTKASTWGFMLLSLRDNKLRVRTYSTAGDMQGRPILEHETSFDRRG